jgi:hypothetical protein
MDDRTKWLLKQPTFWLGLIAGICMKIVAVGLVAPDSVGARTIAGFLSLLNDYGIIVGHLTSAPRTPWTEQQKIDESLRRIARGEPPIKGYEYLQKASSSSPPAPPAPPPPVRPG